MARPLNTEFEEFKEFEEYKEILTWTLSGEAAH